MALGRSERKKFKFMSITTVFRLLYKYRNLFTQDANLLKRVMNKA